MEGACMDKIEQGVAESELQQIIDYYEVDPEGKDWEDSRARLLTVIKKGRLSLDIEDGKVSLQLVSPIELENGHTIKMLEFREPTAADLKLLDKYKESEKMARTIHLASKMTAQPIGVLDRMCSRDLSTMGAIASLFF
jgi:hypothetical protein